MKQQFPNLFIGFGKLERNYHIYLTKGAGLFSFSTPHRQAIPLLPKVKEELTRMEALGPIERVEQPTEWCTRLVVVPKPNGKVSTCVDLSKLNESTCWERQRTLAQLAGATAFSTLDANLAFWQIPLSHESALLILAFPQLRSTFSRRCLQF